jgi:ankyrin repeat protein
MLAILNAQNKAGNTALHWAALNGHLEAVKVLLEEGSDPTITNQRGHDAVYEAELNDKKEVVEWVLKEGGEGLESGVAGEGVEGEADEVADENDPQEESAGKDYEMAKEGAVPVVESTKLEKKLEEMGI